MNSIEHNNTREWKFVSRNGNFIYHFSIIDYLQLYNLNKRLERLGKQAQYWVTPGITPMEILGTHEKGTGYYISSIDPQKY